MKMDIFTFIAKQYGKVIFIFGTDLKKFFFSKSGKHWRLKCVFSHVNTKHMKEI